MELFDEKLDVASLSRLIEKHVSILDLDQLIDYDF